MVFGFEEEGPGHKLPPPAAAEELVRRRTPAAVMTRVAEGANGDFGLAVQTTELGAEMLWYQTEKLKRLGELGRLRKPAAKREFGERRVLFCWDGVHGESLEEKELSCWAEEGGRFERMKARRMERRKVDMVVVSLIGC